MVTEKNDLILAVMTSNLDLGEHKASLKKDKNPFYEARLMLNVMDFA